MNGAKNVNVQVFDFTVSGARAERYRSYGVNQVLST